MKFITSEKVEAALEKNGVQWVLAKYGRYRIAPGFTVADYVKVGEFYGTAGRVRTDERQHPAGLVHQPV